MKIAKHILLLTLSTTLSLPSFAQDALTLSARQNYNKLEILITGVANTTTISKVTINNGYCPASLKLTMSESQRFLNGASLKSVSYPLTIRAGQTRIIQSKGTSCNLQSVDVTTSNGTLTWNW